MADETFAQDFIWYEWGFIAPKDLPWDDLEVPSDSGDVSAATEWSARQEPRDVWPEH